MPLPSAPARARTTFETFKQEAEKNFLVQQLREHDWNVSETARALKMPRSNLYKKIERYGLTREDRHDRAAEGLGQELADIDKVDREGQRAGGSRYGAGAGCRGAGVPDGAAVPRRSVALDLVLGIAGASALAAALPLLALRSALRDAARCSSWARRA